MKSRNLKPTRAVLPKNEQVIGGESHPMTANSNLKSIEKQAQNFIKNAQK